MKNYNIWWAGNYKKRHVVYGQKETKNRQKYWLQFDFWIIIIGNIPRKWGIFSAWKSLHWEKRIGAGNEHESGYT